MVFAGKIIVSRGHSCQKLLYLSEHANIFVFLTISSYIRCHGDIYLLFQVNYFYLFSNVYPKVI